MLRISYPISWLMSLLASRTFPQHLEGSPLLHTSTEISRSRHVGKRVHVDDVDDGADHASRVLRRKHRKADGKQAEEGESGGRKESRRRKEGKEERSNNN